MRTLAMMGRMSVLIACAFVVVVQSSIMAQGIDGMKPDGGPVLDIDSILVKAGEKEHPSTRPGFESCRVVLIAKFGEARHSGDIYSRRHGWYSEDLEHTEEAHLSYSVFIRPELAVGLRLLLGFGASRSWDWVSLGIGPQVVSFKCLAGPGGPKQGSFILVGDAALLARHVSTSRSFPTEKSAYYGGGAIIGLGCVFFFLDHVGVACDLEAQLDWLVKPGLILRARIGLTGII